MTRPRAVRPLGAILVAGGERTDGLASEGGVSNLHRGLMPLPILPRGQTGGLPKLTGEGALVAVAAALGDIADGQGGGSQQA
jgi:hypothetical protein